ncbi:MAG: hypothetical protein ABIJ97_16500 [Bacteroidota bacterium]
MKTLIIALLCLLSIFEIYAQNTFQNNHERYWHYRNRLKYFVKVGTNQGESCVASYRNKPQYENKLKFGDQTIHLGWYIGVLATEFRLLQLNNQNTEKTIYELYCALEAFKRIDMCEDEAPWNDPPGKFDGFFMTSVGARLPESQINLRTRDQSWRGHVFHFALLKVYE